MVLVAPLVWALAHQAYFLALALFVAAAASDGIDGFLARRYGWETPLGAILDPVADKLLLVTAYLMLGWAGFVPWWLVAAVVARDVVILGGAAAYRLLTGAFEVEPTLVSKLNTVLQLVLALVAILADGLGWLPAWSTGLFTYAVLASTVFSGIHYVSVWSRRAWQHKSIRE